MTASSYSDGQCTLLDFVFAEKLAWEHVLSNDLRFFESEKFHKVCDEVENRILTRCAGLVETGEHRDHVLHGVEQCNSWSGDGGAEFIIVGKSQDERSVSRHLREVSFIHKTVIDFLDSRRQTMFQEPNWRPAANLALVRGQLGSISILPLVISEEDIVKGLTNLAWAIERIMFTVSAIDVPEASEETDRAFENVAVEMVDHTYQVVSQVDASLNGTDLLWYKRKFSKLLSPPLGFDSFPFCNCPGFAAFFDCRSYISRYLLLHKSPRDELTYLLACAVAGLRYISVVGIHKSFAPWVPFSSCYAKEQIQTHLCGLF